MIPFRARALERCVTRRGRCLSRLALRARPREFFKDEARLSGRKAYSFGPDLRRDSAWLLSAQRERGHWKGYSAVPHGPRRGYWLPWLYPRRNLRLGLLAAAQWNQPHMPEIFSAALFISNLVGLPRQRPEVRCGCRVAPLLRR